MNTNPKILITIATHGDELIGFAVKKQLENLNIINGQLDFIVANERAFKENKRYIDSDLNRIFPGKKNGNHEEVLAYNLKKIIKKYDVVIDIHSTTSELKDSVIVTKLNAKIRDILNIVNPKYVLYMKISKKHALISEAKIGLAFEYGKDDSVESQNSVTRDITKILFHYNMIEDTGFIYKNNNTKAFEVSKSFPKKNGEKLNNGIENYKLVKKSENVVIGDRYTIDAKDDFYPILFGDKIYETMFGFVGKKIELK